MERKKSLVGHVWPRDESDATQQEQDVLPPINEVQ